MVDVKTGRAIPRREPKAKRPAGSVPNGGTGVAAQCVALISTLMSFAVARGLRSDNPATGVKKPPTRKMERFLSEEEIARLARALDAETAASGNPYPSAAIRLLLLTGKSEILNFVVLDDLASLYVIPRRLFALDSRFENYEAGRITASSFTSYEQESFVR